VATGNPVLYMKKKYLVYFLLFFSSGFYANGQVLTLKQAVNTAINNYGIIKAKAGYLKASQALAKGTSQQYLPDVSIGAENVYGTANGIFGPAYPGKILGASSSGPFFLEQNWNSAFGALYLASVNWDFFSFGKVKASEKVANARVLQDTQDLEQEKFQHEVRVAGAYLNLLAAQRLRLSQQKNLDRANALLTVVVTRAKNGLNAGVDSSLANAEMSNAKIALTNAINIENEQAAQLAQLLGVPSQGFNLDTIFLNRIPASLYDSATLLINHPVLKYYQSRIDVSREQEKYYDRLRYPVFSLFGVIQSRGSGFGDQYSVLNPKDFTHNFWSGVQPSTGNYVVGMGVSWNATNFFRLHQQANAQQFNSRGLEGEFEAVSQQIKTQLALADQKITNALSNYREAPVQVKAASDAYIQNSVLYKNGLANIVDITQALFTLNRAETNREIANNNVWQALLFKAAASGDFGLFIDEFQQ
jgi:outer membrane protein TolC